METDHEYGVGDSGSVLVLHAHGPFNLLNDASTPWIFDADEGKRHGIYIWSIQHDGGELVHYVGETGRSFAERFFEHLALYLSGQYKVYEPDAFCAGKRVVIWEGMRQYTNLRDAPEYLKRGAEITQALHQQLHALRLWLVPVDVERRQRCLLESAIARALYDQPDPIGSFQEEGVTYQHRSADEPSVRFRLAGSVQFQGLPETLAT